MNKFWQEYIIDQAFSAVFVILRAQDPKQLSKYKKTLVKVAKLVIGLFPEEDYNV